MQLCEIADRDGMHAIWTGEHHGMDFTIAPNPFVNLSAWTSFRIALVVTVLLVLIGLATSFGLARALHGVHRVARPVHDADGPAGGGGAALLLPHLVE